MVKDNFSFVEPARDGRQTARDSASGGPCLGYTPAQLKDQFRKERGRFGEEWAAGHLESLGYQILWRNYRTIYGEIDIVALEAGEIAFVEVRTFSLEAMIEPDQSVFERKRRKIIRAAKMYVTENPTERACRFDVIGLSLNKRGEVKYVRLIRDAFRVKK
jgi:putative endonuclease